MNNRQNFEANKNRKHNSSRPSYRACSVGRSAINTSSAIIKGLVALDSMGVDVLVQ